MKRAIRENLSTGGVPFRIPQQAPRLKRPHVVLLVDVSWSVARAAGLFLMMALALLDRGRRTSVFFFVDHPVEATEPLRRWLRGAGAAEKGPARAGAAAVHRGSISRSALPSRAGSRSFGRGERPGSGIVRPGSAVSFLDLIFSIPDLDPDGRSDYGRAFFALSSGPLRTLARDAVVVVLGDGRTNRFDPLPWAFEEIAGRARHVLWLAPEPRGRWGEGDSALPAYLPFCDVVVEASDLEGLARAVRELTASI